MSAIIRRRRSPRSSRTSRCCWSSDKYPAEHLSHLRTTNPIESTIATVRLRIKVAKGPGSRAARIAMAYKLLVAAQVRWRAVNAPHLIALVRTGAVFHKGNWVRCCLTTQRRQTTNVWIALCGRGFAA